MLWILSPKANQEIMVPLRFASRMTGSMTGGESGSRMTGGTREKTFSFFTSFYKKGTALTPGRNHFVEIIKMSNRKPMPFACEGGGFKKRGATTPKNHVLNIKKFSDVNNEYYNNGTRILQNVQHPATIFHSPRVRFALSKFAPILTSFFGVPSSARVAE